MCCASRCTLNPQQSMAALPYFLPHLQPHCTGRWTLVRCPPVLLWQCPACRAIYPDSTWVRDAAAREIRSGEQIRQLANEGQRMLRDSSWGA